ncbi:MAG: DUF4382 domain-containing protein [Thermoanaerobaculia bacterium]
MRTYSRGGVVLGVALTLALAPLLSCSDSDSPSAPSGTMLRIELTDAPTDELSAVNVYISGLTIKPTTGPVERITNDVGLLDLLTLQDTTELLVAAEVESGDYEFIMVELDEAASSVVDAATGEELSLQIPSQEIKVLGGFTVEPDLTTTVLLDFDADRSLIRRGDGRWLLTPVILLANISTS